MVFFVASITIKWISAHGRRAAIAHSVQRAVCALKMWFITLNWNFTRIKNGNDGCHERIIQYIYPIDNTMISLQIKLRALRTFDVRPRSVSPHTTFSYSFSTNISLRWVVCLYNLLDNIAPQWTIKSWHNLLRELFNYKITAIENLLQWNIGCIDGSGCLQCSQMY